MLWGIGLFDDYGLVVWFYVTLPCFDVGWVVEWRCICIQAQVCP